MGYPLSLVMANIFMEEFETRALSSSPSHPRIWLRFVDKTFLVHKAEHTQQFLSHLNSLDPNIQFTTKSLDNVSLPFLDTLISQAPNGTLITTVCRKPTNTDQYLHCDSHHSITSKCSVYNTLSPRVQCVCSDEQLLEQDNQHIHMALRKCNYSDWIFHKLQTKRDFLLSHQQ